MKPQNLPRSEPHDRRTLRCKQNDELELRFAASEVEDLCAYWFVERSVLEARPAL